MTAPDAEVEAVARANGLSANGLQARLTLPMPVCSHSVASLPACRTSRHAPALSTIGRVVDSLTCQR